jgi:predicted TPR repeat methyltransferase
MNPVGMSALTFAIGLVSTLPRKWLMAGKKYVWDAKYGLLGYPHFVAPQDVLALLSSRLQEIGSVLDLGCGRGSLLRALREKGWAGSYCGIDISKRAIDDARKSGDHRSTWVVSDLESFQSPFRWDIVIMVESLYYVRLEELPALLSKVLEMLSPEGKLVFRLHDLAKHRDYVEAVLRLYPRTEQVGQNLFCVSRRETLTQPLICNT